MKKLERRAIISLILAAFLLLGLLFFCFRFVVYGSEWASFPANRDLFADGTLDRGSIYDVNGNLLLENTESGAIYNDDQDIREATLHVVGDVSGNISTGAETKFAGKLTGYNFINGTYSKNGSGRNLYLTIDSEVCKTAYEALDGRSGTVGVYNYKTGEIVCLVSSPAYDPNEGIDSDAAAEEGYYINRFFSATFVPGSTFKTVTAAAVIDNLDYENWSYTCTGSYELGDDTITCPSVHGTVDFEDALCVSCNCAFANLTLALGADTMSDTVDQLGLTKSYSINGISTKAGSFSFSEDNEADLAWAGIGQSEDLVNPCSMMIYMGAVANGGRVVVPQIISSVKTSGNFPLSIYIPKLRSKLVSSDTAATLKAMMRNNVVNNYGEGNLDGYNLCAKSGTAEVGDGTSHSWFVGFLDDEDNPYAFVVLVEHGGSGATVAGSVAKTVLETVVNE